NRPEGCGRHWLLGHTPEFLNPRLPADGRERDVNSVKQAFRLETTRRDHRREVVTAAERIARVIRHGRIVNHRGDGQRALPGGRRRAAHLEAQHLVADPDQGRLLDGQAVVTDDQAHRRLAGAVNDDPSYQTYRTGHIYYSVVSWPRAAPPP